LTPQSDGSLLNLAKHPASTVQILGAEKALLKALKTKHDTLKYGIYHAQLVGQASSKLKGKAPPQLLVTPGKPELDPPSLPRTLPACPPWRSLTVWTS